MNRMWRWFYRGIPFQSSVLGALAYRLGSLDHGGSANVVKRFPMMFIGNERTLSRDHVVRMEPVTRPTNIVLESIIIRSTDRTITFTFLSQLHI